MKSKEEVEKQGLHALEQCLLQGKSMSMSMFILMKTVIFIYRGRHECIANVETYRDRQGQAGTDKDNQGQAWTDRDK